MDGRYVRGISTAQARVMIMGQYGVPIEMTVLRQVQSSENNALKSMISIPFVIVRGVISAYIEAFGRYKDFFHSQSVPNVHYFHPGYATIPSAATNKDEKCGIGIFIERILGCFVVKSINPMGPASKISTTKLLLGNFPHKKTYQKQSINID
jgi:hypothetical protein